MFTRFYRDWGSRGSLAEVWIDENAGLCKKLYKPDGITFRGTLPLHRDYLEIENLYKNEVKWSLTLPSDMTVKLIDHGALENNAGFFIVQEYVGPDLLTYFNNNTLFDHFPDVVDQLENMFNTFKEFNMYKVNNALSNLTGSNGKIKAFDFKYTRIRCAEGKLYEEHSINEWLSKIHPTLKEKLLTYI